MFWLRIFVVIDKVVTQWQHYQKTSVSFWTCFEFMTNNDCSASAHGIWTAVTPNLQSKRIELPEKLWWICLVTWDTNRVWILIFLKVLIKKLNQLWEVTKSTDNTSEVILLLSNLFVFVFSINTFITVIMNDACSDTTQNQSLVLQLKHGPNPFIPMWQGWFNLYIQLDFEFSIYIFRYGYQWSLWW